MSYVLDAEQMGEFEKQVKNATFEAWFERFLIRLFGKDYDDWYDYKEWEEYI